MESAQEHVVLRLGGCRYALAMSSVAEVGRPPGLTRVPGVPVDAAALTTRVARAGGVIVDDPEDLPAGPEQAAMATFLSMRLRGHGGAVVGVLALSSGTKSAFGETALSTLKLIEQPAAIVVDNARLSGARSSV